MAYATFTDALMQAKRASKLRGIPFSTRDVQNLQSGYMEGAAERASAERSSELAEKSLSSQQQNWSDTLAQEKELAGLSRSQSEQISRDQMESQEKASTKAMYGNIGQTAASLGGAYLLSGSGKTAPPALNALGESAKIGTSEVYGSTAAPTVAGAGAAAASQIAGTGYGAAGGIPSSVPISTVPIQGSGYGSASAQLTGTAAPAATGVMSVPGLAGGITAMSYAAPAYIAREGLSAILSNQSGPIPQTQGKLMKEPTLEGLMGAGINEVFNTGEAGKDIAAWGDPVGTAIKWATSQCIIITACTDRHSPEVEIAREFRNKYLDADQMRGYYFIAEKIVPAIESNQTVKRMVKKWLVDRLVDFGAVQLGIKPVMALRSSWIVSKAFLTLIKVAGMMKKQFVRANGEVY
jgi:hypothetical protein